MKRLKSTYEQRYYGQINMEKLIELIAEKVQDFELIENGFMHEDEFTLVKVVFWQSIDLK